MNRVPYTLHSITTNGTTTSPYYMHIETTSESICNTWNVFRELAALRCCNSIFLDVINDKALCVLTNYFSVSQHIEYTSVEQRKKFNQALKCQSAITFNSECIIHTIYSIRSYKGNEFFFRQAKFAHFKLSVNKPLFFLSVVYFDFFFTSFFHRTEENVFSST